MEKLIKQLIENAKTNKKNLVAIREMATKCRNFELANKLIDLEYELFPETPEETTAKEEGKKLNLIFRMVNLNIPDDVAFLVSETIKKYRRRRGNFDLKDATELVEKKERLFSK